MMMYLTPIGIGLAEIVTYSLAFLIVVNGTAAFLGAVTHAVWAAGPRVEMSPATTGSEGGAEGA
jgi:hypothetical protein